MINVNKNQTGGDMTRGGKRDGAGRPKTEVTKQVRIPVSMAGVARELVDIYKERLIEKLHEERWFSSAPENEKGLINLENIRIENMNLGSILGGMSEEICVVGDARHPNGEGVTVWVKI